MIRWLLVDMREKDKKEGDYVESLQIEMQVWNYERREGN